MRFETRRAFAVSSPFARGRSVEGGLPIEIAFLEGRIADNRRLFEAARIAKRSGVCPARALVAEGFVSETLYYRALARHLGMPFVDDWPGLADPADPVDIVAKGAVKLALGSRDPWLLAPEGAALRTLVKARAADMRAPGIAITSPSHLRAIAQLRGSLDIAYHASEALPDTTPTLSAKRTASLLPRLAMLVIPLTAIVGLAIGSRLVADAFGLVFLASMVLRVLVCAEGVDQTTEPATSLSDADLPTYSVLVPLRNETDIIPDLIEALDRIEYPRAKIEVLFLVEPEDAATRATLANAALPPWCHVLVGPSDGGSLRTKPRALNIGLMFARGSLVTVYDAEDRPDPDQLRSAAARFREDPKIACLQARLAIANGGKSVWSQLFAIEYAVLFDLFNIGTSSWHLPMALGGTSNHFRTDVLRGPLGGWDAWNVTEDADLGLRLARHGYGIGSLMSTTIEEAPERFGAWMKQRRRWTKGWMQTLLVLAWDGRTAWRQYGPFKAALVVLMLTNLVTGPLLLPLFGACVVYHLVAKGLPSPDSPIRLVEATIASFVIILGIGSTLWTGCAGVRQRRLGRFIFSVPLLLPYQLLISVAAWLGLIDLLVRPFHWHKTAHGRAARRKP